MKDKEEMIELGSGEIINKKYYNSLFEEYCKTNETDFAPLTYDGKVIGRAYQADNQSNRMTFKITTEEGKKIIDEMLHQSIGISSRKMGSILEDGTVDDSHQFTEFSILKDIQ